MGLVDRAVSQFSGVAYAGSGTWSDAVGGLSIAQPPIEWGMTEAGLLSGVLAAHRTAASIHVGDRVKVIARLNLDLATIYSKEYIGRPGSWYVTITATGATYTRYTSTTASTTVTLTPAGGWPPSGWNWIMVESTAAATKLYVSSDPADTALTSISWTEVATGAALTAPFDSGFYIELGYSSSVSLNGVGGIARLAVLNSTNNQVFLDWRPSDFAASAIVGGTLTTGGTVAATTGTIDGRQNRAFFTYPGVTFNAVTGITLGIGGLVSSKDVTVAMICRLLDLSATPASSVRMLLGLEDNLGNEANVVYDLGTSNIQLVDAAGTQIGTGVAAGAATQDAPLNIGLINDTGAGKIKVLRNGVEIINENTPLAGASIDNWLINKSGSIAGSQCAVNDMLLWDEVVGAVELVGLEAELHPTADDIWRDLVRGLSVWPANTERTEQKISMHALFVEDQVRIW